MINSRALPPLNIPRAEPILVPLNDGRVLTVGGWIIDREAGYQRKPVAACEVLAADRKRWRNMAAPERLPEVCAAGTLTLPDGKTLRVGGVEWKGGEPHGKRETEQSAIHIGAKRLPRMTLNRGRIGGVLTLLPDGRVLVTGGYETHIDFSWETVRTSVRDVEIIDLKQRTVVSAGKLIRARHHHAAALLSDGSVLLAGGRHDEGPEEGHVELLTFSD